MGLFSGIGKALIKGVVDSVVDSSKKIGHFEEKYKNLDEDHLFYAYDKGTIAEKSVAFKFLKERYLNEDSINTMLQVKKSVGFDYSVRSTIESIRYEVDRITGE